MIIRFTEQCFFLLCIFVYVILLFDNLVVCISYPSQCSMIGILVLQFSSLYHDCLLLMLLSLFAI